MMRKQTYILYLDEFQHALQAPNQKGVDYLANIVKGAMQDLRWPIWMILSGVPDLLTFIERDPFKQMKRRAPVVWIDELSDTPDDGDEDNDIGDATVRRILCAMGHIPTHNPNKGDQFLSSAGAEEAITMLNGSMLSSEAAKIIGCEEHVFLRLAAEGFFTPLHFERRTIEDRNYVMLDRFARSEIEGFKIKLDNAVTARPAPEMISMAAAAGLIGVHQKQILKLVLEGRLGTVAMKKTRGPFSSRLLVLDREVYSELGLPVGVSAAETSLRLGIQRSPLAALVARGVLNPVSFGLKHRQVYDERELDEFRSAYISFGAACTEFGFSRMELMVKLKRLEIAPAFPKEEIGVFLIARSDIPRLLAATDSEHAPVAA